MRAYAFMAQIMTWTDRELERLYLFGKALATQLPRGGEDEPIPLVSDQVELTHLRTALTAEEENAALTEGDDTPGEVLPGEGKGGQDPLVDKLSALVERLNDKFGIGTTDATRSGSSSSVWRSWLTTSYGSSRCTTPETPSISSCANVFRTTSLPGTGENTKMFDLFFNKPGFQQLVVEYLGEMYEEFRRPAADGGTRLTHRASRGARSATGRRRARRRRERAIARLALMGTVPVAWDEGSQRRR